AAIAAAEGKNITVLPGMEITSVEEVHIIGLFEAAESALCLQETVYKYLPPGENREDIFGEQIVANERDEVDGFNKRLLTGAVSMTLKEIVEEIHNLGGLAIAAHIDREVYSIMGQLGFIPEDLELDALEITANTTRARAYETFPGIERFSLIRSSDAHYLDDIGTSVSTFLMERPSLEELRGVFLKKGGRSISREG
ncbi:MAG: histidinol phosphatase, partial [bacterium]|nr:histidinol phosphatase [bacterium]